jgi:hypothetical protein
MVCPLAKVGDRFNPQTMTARLAGEFAEPSALYPDLPSPQPSRRGSFFVSHPARARAAPSKNTVLEIVKRNRAVSAYRYEAGASL